MKRLLGLLLVMGMVGCGKQNGPPPGITNTRPGIAKPLPENAAPDPLIALKNLGAEITSNEQGAISVNLELQGTGTSIDAELVHLKALEDRLGKLESLNLGIALITDTGLAHLKDLTNLKDLRIDGNKISDAGLAHLKNLTKLELLNLRMTPITDEGLVHIKGLANLQELDLGFTYVTDAGVAELRKALPKCSISGGRGGGGRGGRGASAPQGID